MTSAAQRSSPLSEPDSARLLAAARLFFLRRGHAPDRDDLAQEALAVTLEAVRGGQLQARERPAAFMLGVCRNLAARSLRDAERAERARLKLMAPAAEEPPSRFDLQKLWTCFNLLSARARDVLVRTYVDDETAQAIGRALRMSEGNVRVVRHRALLALQQCVEEGRP